METDCLYNPPSPQLYQDEVHNIKMAPIHPYPTFGIYLDTTLVYCQMYVYEATLRVYHEGQYSTETVESWCP